MAENKNQNNSELKYSVMLGVRPGYGETNISQEEAYTKASVAADQPDGK